MLMGPFAILRISLAFLLLLCWQTSYAQESVQQTPLDKYYNDHALALPEVFPAKEYTADQMMERLLQIAEGPELSREQLEKEFGIRFVREPRGESYVARGRKPLGSRLSSYSGFWPAAFITLHFDGRPTPAKEEQEHSLCLDAKKMVQALEKGWRPLTKNQSLDGRGNLEISYIKTLGGHVREVYIYPHAGMLDPWSSTGACMNYFSVNYRYKK